MGGTFALRRLYSRAAGPYHGSQLLVAG